MKKYDLHIHSIYSGDSLNKPENILKIAKKKGLDGIAVADHNTWKGYQKIKALKKDKNFEIVPAMEICTQYRDVLVYYLNEEITSRDLFEVIDKAHRQGAIVSIAHPFRFTRPFGYDIGKLKVDAIEGFNARTLNFSNKKAKRTAKELRLATTGGSDGHFGFEIGNGYSLFDGDLVQAIKKHKVEVGGTTKYLLLAKALGLAGFVKKKLTL